MRPLCMQVANAAPAYMRMTFNQIGNEASIAAGLILSLPLTLTITLTVSLLHTLPSSHSRDAARLPPLSATVHTAPPCVPRLRQTT